MKKEILIFATIVTFVHSLELYPYGTDQNDELDFSVYSPMEFYLQRAMPLFKDPARLLWIDFEGSITVNYSKSGLSLRSEYVRLLPYQTPVSPFSGKIYCRQSFNASLLTQASNDVMKYISSDFVATQAIIITFLDLLLYSSTNTYQVILVTNDVDTYAILLYQNLSDGDAITGFNDGICHQELFGSKIYSKSLAFTSNVGEPGKHVKLLTRREQCTLKVFYEHGGNLQQVPKGTDTYGNLSLSRPMPLLAGTFSQFYVSVDGSVTMEQPLTTHVYMNKHPIINIYHADFDTTNGGAIYYEETYRTEILDKATKDIQAFEQNTFVATQVVMATYYDVFSANSPEKTNSFQMVLASDGNDTYLILQYFKLESSATIASYSGYDNCNSFIVALNSDTQLLKEKSTTGLDGTFIYKLSTPRNCSVKLFYPHGDGYGDVMLDSISENIELDKAMPFFNSKWLSVDTTGTVYVEKFYETSEVPALAMYEGRMYGYPGYIEYRESYHADMLNRASEDVRKLSKDNFNATQLLILTFFNMQPANIENTGNTFQTVLATDGVFTYAILMYEKVDGVNARIGYTTPKCDWTLLKYSGGESRKVEQTSNVGTTGKHIMLLEEKCPETVLYPYGEQYGDHMTSSESTKEFTLSENMFILGRDRSHVYIHSHGYISFNPNITARQIWLPYEDSVIAAYSLDLNITKHGSIFYRSTKNEAILSKATADVQAFDANTDFIATNALIITYYKMAHNAPTMDRNTFQVVIASSSNKTYLIFNYHQLDTPRGTAGYTNEGCDFVILAESVNARMLVTVSNVNQNGRLVRYVETSSCNPTVFYSYGTFVGDKEHARHYSKYVAVNLQQDMPFFKEMEDTFYIVTNGYISTTPTSTTSSTTLKRYTMVAALVKSCDVRAGGSVFYRESVDAVILKRASADVHKSNIDVSFQANHAFIVSFSQIKCGTRRYTFQLILATDGNETYAIKNYLAIPAFSGYVGHSEPSCKQSSLPRLYESDLVTTSNTGELGQHVSKLTDLLCGATTARPITTQAATTTEATTITEAKTTTTEFKTTTTTIARTTTDPTTTQRSTTPEQTTAIEPEKDESSEDSAVLGGSIAGGVLLLIIIVVVVVIAKRKSGDTDGRSKIEKNNNFDEEPVVFQNKAYEAGLEENGR